ncbi:MAG: V-type ATP synthase subunit D [Lentisphaeria bacterium]|nr:V-type ATP synthase subunit D [Lentisphaeria bacterium]
MAKIKLTKTELKKQQDALKQYKRFLPTLQLKKQQLQMEIRNSIDLLEANLAEQEKFSASLKSFIALFGADVFFNGLLGKVRLQSIRKGTANIAGVNVPTFEAAIFEATEYDPYRMPWSFRDAIKSLQDFVSLKEAYVILEEQHRLLNDELRTTTQRVNLFEKVKIPECKANIRTIGIQLGDLSTAAVARSKIAKKKTMEANAL